MKMYWVYFLCFGFISGKIAMAVSLSFVCFVVFWLNMFIFELNNAVSLWKIDTYFIDIYKIFVDNYYIIQYILYIIVNYNKYRVE